MKYAAAATASTHREDIIACAALRDRPSPVLINASPAPASGTSSMHRAQMAAAKSESAAGGFNSFPPAPASATWLTDSDRAAPRRLPPGQTPHADRPASASRLRPAQSPNRPAIAGIQPTSLQA